MDRDWQDVPRYQEREYEAPGYAAYGAMPPGAPYYLQQQAPNYPPYQGNEPPRSYSPEGGVGEGKRVQRLYSGDRLLRGDMLLSESGESRAVMQPDGNFVVYRGWEGDEPDIKFATATYEGNPLGLMRGGSFAAQDDGNLVVYTDDGRVAWTSNSYQDDRDDYVLELTNGGTLIWRPTEEEEPVWTSERYGDD